MKRKSLKCYLTTFSLIFILNPLFCQEKANETFPLKEGKARIVFTRKSSMMGAITPHLIVDKGDSLNYNAFIVQKKFFPSEKSNFDVGGNVTTVYWIMSDKSNILMAGYTLGGDKKISKDSIFSILQTKPNIPVNTPNYLKSLISCHLNTQALSPNYSLAGIVKSGETIVWDRDPGTMQLQVITIGGDQAFAPSFKVEAGKTYVVTYTYMKAYFEIIEKK
jgi:hypothetical protein